MNSETKRIGEFLAKYRYKSYCNETAIYLQILAFIHSEHPEDFIRITEIRGLKRIYFSEDPSEIIDSGNSTMPERIPGTAFFAYANDNCERKEELCHKVVNSPPY